MRWSLVLYSLIAVQSALSFFCVALAIPSQWDELERREPKRGRQPGPHPEWKLSSQEYRNNAKEHPHAYHVKDLGPNGKMTEKTTVSRTELQSSNARSDHAKKMLNDHRKRSPIHADHVFEVQMLADHLKRHGVHDLKPGSKIHDKVKGILNGKENMAFIPGSINQSKGQLIKHGMQGKKIRPQKARDDYAIHSYPTALETAKKLDEALKHHPGYSKKVGRDSLQKKLHGTFVAAGHGHSIPPLHPASTRPSTPPRPNTAGPSRQSNPGHPSPDRRLPDSSKRSAPSGNSPPKKKGGRK